MLIDYKLSKAIQDFTKYAKFISDKFDVEVQFDGVNAATDGKTIYLPNIAGLTEKEIDFLYCVLLHEVGHVKYTKEFFQKEELKKVKTENHLNMINAIEDARIENLLMKDFDGAKVWFDKLYNLYTADDKFMYKVFGGGKSNCAWFGLSIYAHNYYINLKITDPVDSILTKSAAKELNLFIQNNNIDNLLKKSDVSTWEGILKLSNKLYSLYFDNKKDNSAKNDLSQDDKSLDESSLELSKIEKETQKIIEKIKKLQEENRNLKEGIDEFKSEQKEKLEPLLNQRKEVSQSIDSIENLSDIRETKEELDSKIFEYNQKMKELNDKKEEYNKQLEELNKKSSLDEKETKKQHTLNKRISSLEEKSKQIQKQIDKQSIKKNEADALSKDIKEEILNMSDKQIEKTQKELSQTERSLDSQIGKIQGKQHKDQSQYDANKNMINQLNSELKQKSMESLKEIQKKLEKSGLPVAVLPSFVPDETWPDSNGAQQAFDEQAMMESESFVCHGVGSGQGSRDVIAIIEKARHDIDSLDLGKLFHKKNSLSKLDTLNEISQMTNTQDQGDSDIGKSLRKHISLTTQYDAVKTENQSSGKITDDIKIKHKDIISKVKNLFRSRLKFSKKDFFKGNKEDGRLDTRSLYKLATNMDSNFWEENHPKFINQLSASIVIDISGSMDKEISEYGKKLRELACFLSEGLKECHIKHEVLGFHAPVCQEMRDVKSSPIFNRKSNKLETIVYKKFQDSNNKGLDNLEIKCSDNSDGESLRLAFKRLSQERSKKKIMFVITDGKPFLSDADTDVLDQDLKDTLIFLKQNKVEVFAFGFNDQPKQFYGDKYCKISNYIDLLNFINKKMY